MVITGLTGRRSLWIPMEAKVPMAEVPLVERTQ